MKKRRGILILATAVAVMSMGTVASCESSSKVVGGITLSNMQEGELRDLLKKTGVEQEVVFYDDLNTLVMAVQYGKVDEADIFGYMAEYAASRNDNLKCEYPEQTIEDSMQMAVRAEDTELKEELNTAIRDMKEDSTLEKLTKEYIEDVINGSDPTVEKMEPIEGAGTIKVAVTGACAPFDYADSEGNPAGFNVAVLSEIGKRLNKNIELVTVAASARVTALSSKKADIIFWTLAVDGDNSADLPDGITATDAFCTSGAAVLTLK